MGFVIMGNVCTVCCKNGVVCIRMSCKYGDLLIWYFVVLEDS